MAAGATLGIFDAAQASVVATADATFDEVNGQSCLDFDATTKEEIKFRGIMPQQYGGGGIDCRCKMAMSSATTGNVDVDVSWERQTGLDLTTSSFAAVQSTDNTTVPGTAGTEFTVTVSFTSAQIDSVVAGDMFRLKFERDAAADTAAGDLELRSIELRET